MADEDRTRAQSQGANEPTPGRRRTGRTPSTPRRTAAHCAGSPAPGGRRRWALEGIAALVCLIVLGIVPRHARRTGARRRRGRGPGGVPAERPGRRLSRRRGTYRRGWSGDAGSAPPGAPALARPHPQRARSAVRPAAQGASGAGAVGEPGRGARRDRPERRGRPGLDALGAARRQLDGPQARRLRRDRRRRRPGATASAGTATRRCVRWSDGTPERTVERQLERRLHLRRRQRFQPRGRAAVVSRAPSTCTPGSWMARGRLDARLSTGGPDQHRCGWRTRTPVGAPSSPSGSSVPRGARLVVTWTVEKVFTEHCGNVGLQAVALR